MDSSPSVQAGSGEGSGNQAAGEWVPTNPVVEQRPNEESRYGVTDLANEALHVCAAVPPTPVAAGLNERPTLAYVKRLQVHGVDSDYAVGHQSGDTTKRLVRKKAHGIGNGRTNPLEEPADHLSLTREEPSISTSFPESTDSEETYVRVQLGPILRATNADFMFSDGDFHAERNGHLYYKYASLSTAQAVCHRVNKGNSFRIKVGVDANWDTPDKEKRSHCDENGRKEDTRPKKKNKLCEENELAVESGERKATEAAAAGESKVSAEVAAAEQLIKGEMRIRMDTTLFKWRPITNFCSIKGNECVACFKFNVAQKFGSICSSVTMSTNTDIGNMLFPSLVTYLFKAFEKKLSWGGKIGLHSLVIDENGNCAIVPVPLEKATDSNIVKDLTGLVHSLEELYMVDGILPPYYADLISFLSDVPAGIADDTEILKQALLQLVNHSCFLSDDKKMGLLQEFYIFFKNLDEAAKNKFNEDTAEMSNSGWQDIPEIDCLLSGVKKASKTLQDTFVDQSSYLRHLGVHIPDQMFMIWLEVQKMMVKIEEQMGRPLIFNLKRNHPDTSVMPCQV